MATIKSYTDLEQSKKLAKILNHESADMVYVHTIDLEGDEHYDIDFRNNQPLFEDDICAWSLAALFAALPDRICLDNEKYYLSYKKDKVEYLGPLTWDGQKCIASKANTIVDACVAMIEELHKLNLL